VNSTAESTFLRRAIAIVALAWVMECTGCGERSPAGARTEPAGAASTMSAAGSAGRASTSPPQAVTATVCPEYPWGRKGRHEGFSAVDAHPAQFAAFLSDLKRAISSDDRAAVSALVSFPVGNLSMPEFLERYDAIMTSCLKASILCTTVDEVAEDYLGAWLAHDALLVEWTEGRFLITGFSGEGPCYPKRSPP
jgi:hypothetical protein